jgi:hypothetical protein
VEGSHVLVGHWHYTLRVCAYPHPALIRADIASGIRTCKHVTHMQSRESGTLHGACYTTVEPNPRACTWRQGQLRVRHVE